MVKSYGKQLWLDPGASAAEYHSVAVILDVVRRYDIDGVHLGLPPADMLRRPPP